MPSGFWRDYASERCGSRRNQNAGFTLSELLDEVRHPIVSAHNGCVRCWIERRIGFWMQQQRQDGIVEGEHSLLRLRGTLAQLRQFLDDVAIEADLPRDAAKSLDRLSKWSRVQLLEVGDSETPHLPLAFCIANVAPDSKHSDMGLKQAGSNIRGYIPRRLTVVNDVPVLNVNRNDLFLPPTMIGTP